MWEKTVTCDVGTAQCEDENHQMWEKSKRTTQREKRTVTFDVETAQCEDGTIKYEKKKVRQPPSERKKIVTCDVGTTQNKDGTVKCEKKVREPPNVRKELSHMMLGLHNVRMESSNMRKK